MVPLILVGALIAASFSAILAVRLKLLRDTPTALLGASGLVGIAVAAVLTVSRSIRADEAGTVGGPGTLELALCLVGICMVGVAILQSMRLRS